MQKKLSRRDFLKAGGLTLLGAVGANAISHAASDSAIGNAKVLAAPAMQHDGHDGDLPNTVGEVDHEKNGFHPDEILTNFDYGEVSTLPNGQTLREYEIVSLNKNIEVVPGIVLTICIEPEFSRRKVDAYENDEECVSDEDGCEIADPFYTGTAEIFVDEIAGNENDRPDHSTCS